MAREIDSDEKNIAPGWPRPYYRGGDGRPEFVQWITDKARMQIMSCHNDKTYAAGRHHLCTSCGEGMDRGLIFDRSWINRKIEEKGGVDFQLEQVSNSKLGVYDTHYGGSICYRCALFALKHCPMFSAFDREFGDELEWFVTTSHKDTYEDDDTTALAVRQDRVDKTTTKDIREAVASGNLMLRSLKTLDKLQKTKRPGGRNSDFHVRE